MYKRQGKAGAGWLNAGYEGEKVVDGMGAPGVGVGAGVSGDLGPCAEVKGQEFAPGVDGRQVLVREADVVERAGKVEAEIVGGAEGAIGGGAGIDGEHLAQDLLPAVFGDDVVEDGQDVGLLAEALLVGGVGYEAAGGGPAFVVESGADVGGARLITSGEERVAEGLFEIGGFAEGAQVLEGGDAGFALGVVGGDLLLVTDPVNEAPQMCIRDRCSTSLRAQFKKRNQMLNLGGRATVQAFGLVGAGPVDSRMTSSGAMTTSEGYSFSRWAMRWRRIWAPRRPISRRGWRTVVSLSLIHI